MLLLTTFMQALRYMTLRQTHQQAGDRRGGSMRPQQEVAEAAADGAGSGGRQPVSLDIGYKAFALHPTGTSV